MLFVPMAKSRRQNFTLVFLYVVSVMLDISKCVRV